MSKRAGTVISEMDLNGYLNHIFRKYKHSVMRKISILACCIFCFSLFVTAQKFNGIDVNMGNLYRLSDAKSRSISPENFNGEKGKGGMATNGTGAGPSKELGQGWKVSPSVV